MIKLGTQVFLHDNSGAYSLKVINLKKCFFNSYSTISDLIFGVIIDHNIFKKKIRLKRKNKVIALVVCVKKTINRQNGCFLRFSLNRCIPLKITRFIVPVAQRVFTCTSFELKRLKKFKSVIRFSGKSY